MYDYQKKKVSAYKVFFRITKKLHIQTESSKKPKQNSHISSTAIIVE